MTASADFRYPSSFSGHGTVRRSCLVLQAFTVFGKLDLTKPCRTHMDRVIAYAKAHPHPEQRERTVWEMFEAERPSLGFVDKGYPKLD